MNRQAAKTRSTIQSAFSELVFSRRYEEIRMTDIAQAANVGRSTLYQHFPDKDSLLIANMDGILTGLAQTTSGLSAHDKVKAILEHFWDHRPPARRVLFGGTGEKLEAALAAIILTSLKSHLPMTSSPVFTANKIAAVIFSVLRTWLRGEAAGTPDELASDLCLSSAALCAAGNPENRPALDLENT
jgi:AcrR family transcriptional regulator